MRPPLPTIGTVPRGIKYRYYRHPGLLFNRVTGTRYQYGTLVDELLLRFSVTIDYNLIINRYRSSSTRYQVPGYQVLLLVP